MSEKEKAGILFGFLLVGAICGIIGYGLGADHTHAIVCNNECGTYWAKTSNYGCKCLELVADPEVKMVKSNE